MVIQDKGAVWSHTQSSGKHTLTHTSICSMPHREASLEVQHPAMLSRPGKLHDTVWGCWRLTRWPGTLRRPRWCACLEMPVTSDAISLPQKETTAWCTVKEGAISAQQATVWRSSIARSHTNRRSTNQPCRPCPTVAVAPALACFTHHPTCYQAISRQTLNGLSLQVVRT